VVYSGPIPQPDRAIAIVIAATVLRMAILAKEKRSAPSRGGKFPRNSLRRQEQMDGEQAVGVSVLIVGGKSGSNRLSGGGLPIFRRTKEGRSWKAPIRLMA